MTREQLEEKRIEAARKMQDMCVYADDDKDKKNPLRFKEVYDKDEFKKLHEAHADFQSKLIALDEFDANKIPQVDRVPEVKTEADRRNISLDEMSATVEAKKEAIGAWVEGQNLSLEQAHMLTAASGINIDHGGNEKGAMEANISRTSDSGVLVDDVMLSSFITRKRFIGSLFMYCDIENVTTGNQRKAPTIDLRTTIGNVYGQPASEGNLPQSDPGFGSILVDTNVFTSLRIVLDWDAEADSPLPLLAGALNTMDVRLRRCGMQTSYQGSAGISGTLSPQNKGVLEDITTEHDAATGENDNISWTTIWGAIGKLDPAYQMNAGIFMNHTTFNHIAGWTVSTSDDRPLFSPMVTDRIEGQNAPGAVGYLRGYPVYLIQAMPNLAAQANAIIIGDPSTFKIYQSQGYTVYRVGSADLTSASQRADSLLGYQRWGHRNLEPDAWVKVKQAA